MPILNFDIARDYRELTGKPVAVKSRRFRGQQIAMARQQVRFRLDERGAVLKSEAIVAVGIAEDIIFDKPFLVMLQYEKGKQPYFALWVDNPEILVSSPQ